MLCLFTGLSVLNISLPMLHELNAPLTNSYLLAVSLEAKAIVLTEKKNMFTKGSEVEKQVWFRRD